MAMRHLMGRFPVVIGLFRGCDNILADLRGVGKQGLVW